MRFVHRLLALAILCSLAATAGCGKTTGHSVLSRPVTVTLTRKTVSATDAPGVVPSTAPLPFFPSGGGRAEADWPRFTCSSPRFLQMWQWGDKRPIWMAMDRTGKMGGQYDLLYVDANRDGRIGKGERLQGVEGKLLKAPESVFHGVVKIPIPGSKGKALPVFVASATLNGNTMLSYGAAEYLEGQVQFGDKSRIVRLADGNENGVFDDCAEDRLFLADGTPEWMGVSRVLQYKGQLLDMKLSSDSRTLTLSPYKGKLGTLHPTISSNSPTTLGLLVLTSKDGLYLQYDVTGATPNQFPAGDYDIDICVLDGVRGNTNWEYVASGGTVRIVAGKATRLVLGKAAKLSISVERGARDSHTLAILTGLAGRAGESNYAIDRSDRSGSQLAPPNAHVTVRDVSGAVVFDRDAQGPSVEWTPPASAKKGDVFAIEASWDTGPLAGVVKGSTKYTVR